MASLRTTPSGSYIVCFRFNGRQYQRALKTKDPAAAKAALGRVEDAIYQIATGGLPVPPDVDTANFVVWRDAAVTRAEQRDTDEIQVPSLDEVIEQYLEAHHGLKADSTLGTERSHLNNLKSCLGSKVHLAVDCLGQRDLNDFLGRRRNEVQPVTVTKERQTIILLFDWAVRRKLLTVSPATDLDMFKVGRNRDPFHTIEEVEEIVARGGLSDEEELRYWESLFLTQEEIGEVLGLVEKQASHDFIHPMFAIAAYTGMRRGEIVSRLRWSDINFTREFITARSKKQSRQCEETSREIALHPEVEAILRAYRAKRPRGQHVICPANTLLPLTVRQAHGHFQRTLRGTRWERELPSGRKKVIIGFHTFRHSFTSNLAMQGVDQRIIDKWMGHQTEDMRRRYQHLFPRNLSEGIRKLSFAIQERKPAS